MGRDVGNVVMERLFEGRRLKTLDDGAGGRRIRWAAAGGVDGGVKSEYCSSVGGEGGSGAEGRDGR